MTLSDTLNYLAAISTAIGAVLSYKASTVEIRDSLDQFISDLHKQGRWGFRAAIVNSVVAFMLIVGLIASKAGW